MGDRVLFQVKSAGEISPVAYGHWSGGAAPDICARLKKRMVGREGDPQYTFARLVQEMTNNDTGNSGFGCWNQPTLLSKSDSHGDAGIVIIDCTGPLKFEVMGGYLRLDESGMPVEKRDGDD